MKKRYDPVTDSFYDPATNEAVDPPRMARMDLGRLHTQNAGYPMVAEAAGCHPDDAAEQAEFCRSRGCRTEYTKGGDPIWTSREHRRKWLQTMGMHDRNSCG